MKKSKHNIDTGKLIEEIMIKHKITKTELGRIINRKGITVLSYLRNSSIQTGILLDLSHALKHNFFKDIADQLPKDFTQTNDKQITENTQEMEQLREQIKVLTIQNEIMKKALNIKD